jgi:hypothetical protein
MKQRVLYSVFFLCSVCLSWPSAAQVAGQTFGGCPERFILSRPGQFELAAALSLLQRNGVVVTGNDEMVSVLWQCASSIPYHACTDGLLFEMMDPKGAVGGGLAGMTVDMMRGGPSVLGGLLGAGVFGTAAGQVKAASCQKDVQEVLRPAAASAFQGWRVDFQSVREDEVRGRITDAAASGRITYEQASRLDRYVAGVASRLSGRQ